MFYNFTPAISGKKLSVTTSSSSTSIPAAASNEDIFIFNSGTGTAYVAFGVSSATAVVPTTSSSNGSMPIPAGYAIIINKGGNDTIAAITDTGTTATLEFCVGKGA